MHLLIGYLYDLQINYTESVIVGTDREEVLERIQKGFERQYTSMAG